MRLTYHLAGILTGLFVMSANLSAQSIDGESQAIGVVEKLHKTLIETMKNAGKLGFKGRYAIIAPVVESSFDTPLIVQVVLSRYWKELTPAQQGQFVELFNRLSASTYASRFDSYDEESFKTQGVEELKKGRLLVKTELLRKNETPVKLEYLVQQNAGKWYIISVIADGVNDLALKRAEYATIINDKGFDSLVGEIEKKIHELETTN
jgi:phospholipid transport system substrate-binding protein